MIRQTLTAVALLATAAPAAHAGTGTAEFFGTIRGQGSILKGSGVTSSSKLATGRYEVVFPRDVSGCVYVATPNIGGAYKAVARNNSANPNSVLVNTFLNAANAQDVPFNILVKCQD